MRPNPDAMNGASKPMQSADVDAPLLRSSELLRGRRRIVIEHGNARYTLLLTRNDKLILTK